MTKENVNLMFNDILVLFIINVLSMMSATSCLHNVFEAEIVSKYA